MERYSKTSQASDPQAYAIIGAAMAVHRELGCGFLERVYRVTLRMELMERGVPLKTEVRFAINFKGKPTGLVYYADFVCFGDVIVEIKAQKAIIPADRAQLINYLKVSGCKRGLLLNFGTGSLQYERFVL